jgi:hydroxypyruvate isomerase
VTRLPERLAANVAWLFTEHPWLDRFAAARDAGFAAVEFPWPDDPEQTAAAVAEAGTDVAMFNMDGGDLAAGQRGWPNDPTRVDEWREDLDAALDLAARVGCPTINVLAGNRVARVTDEEQLTCLEENLRWALPRAAHSGLTLVTELLNRRENPDYLLTSLDEVDHVLDHLAPLGWRLQLDTWHLGLADVNVAAAIRRVGARIGHVQVADVPGRHEPGSGSLDWTAIRAALEAAGYGGPIGLEYRPSKGTVASLSDLPGALIGPI